MKLGTQLYNKFQKAIKNCGCKRINEICLFGKLKESFDQLNSRYYKTKVIHSNATSGTTFEMPDDYVSFTLNNKPHKNGLYEITAELADLLIIAYSPKNRLAKMTFMQNKYDRNYRCNDQFYLDVFQLYLLKYRPNIIKSKVPFVNGSFLQNAFLPSICSYGVFYQDNACYNMNYYRADHIDINGWNYNHKRENLPFNGTIGKIDIIKGECDLQGCRGLVDFGNALQDFKIGSPISVRLKKFLCHYFTSAPEDFVNMEIKTEKHDEDYYLNQEVLKDINLDIVFVCIDEKE